MVRRLLLLAAAVGLIAPLAAPPAALGATLIEARIGERPARLVVDQGKRRVLVSMPGGERKLVDLARGEVYLIAGGGTARRFATAGSPAAPDGFWLDPWGPGPEIVGYATTYHVVMAGDRICAEVLASNWRDEFMADAMRALDLIQRIEKGFAADPCAAPPFAAYAAAGWPIMAGLIDRALFETVAVRHNYVPATGELDPPSRFADAPTS